MNAIPTEIRDARGADRTGNRAEARKPMSGPPSPSMPWEPPAEGEVEPVDETPQDDP